MGNRQATHVPFGWDFQSNAALVLMIKNVKNTESIKVEGKTEDIELKLDNGKRIYAQAKSNKHPNCDFRNVISALTKSLKTLSEASEKEDADILLFVTNSHNPFNAEFDKMFFGAEQYYNFSDLMPEYQQRINDIIEKEKLNIDTSKLHVFYMNFMSDIDDTRYGTVKKNVDELIANIAPELKGHSNQLMQHWQLVSFRNSTKQEDSFAITKAQFIWPVIVEIINTKRIDSDDLIDLDCDIDEADFESAMNHYSDFINNHCEKFELISKVNTDYNQYCHFGKSRKIHDFIIEKWSDYNEDICVAGLPDEVAEAIQKVIIRKILYTRRDINRVKQEVNLK